MVGRLPGEGWLATERRPIIWCCRAGRRRVAACGFDTVADLAERIVLLKPLAEPAPQPACRDTIMPRLRPVLWELGIASVVINLLALATPLFLMTVYNKVINHGALQTLDVLVLGMITLFVFEWLLRSLRSYIASHTGGRLDAALGSEVVHHLVHLPLRTFEAVPTGQILERTRQLDQLRQFFTSQMPLLLVDLAVRRRCSSRCCSISTSAWARSRWPRCRCSGCSRCSPAGRTGGWSRRASAAAAAKASSLGETVSQALTVKALGLEPEMERRFKQKLAEAAWTGFRASNLGGLIASSGQALQHVVALVIVYVGARAIIAGDMSIGALIAATILAARALAPIRQVVGAWQQLQTVRTAFARLDELMNEPTELRRAPGPALRAARPHPLRAGRLPLRRRRPRRRSIGVDLEIAPGQMLGVVGPPGSGKSTFAKLLLGLDQPEHGRVLIDDLDVRLWSPAVLRQQIGVVPQEVQLFAGTIAENIALGAARPRVRAGRRRRQVRRRARLHPAPAGRLRHPAQRARRRPLRRPAPADQHRPRADPQPAPPGARRGDQRARRRDRGGAPGSTCKRASRGRTIVMVTHRLGALAIADRVRAASPTAASSTRASPARSRPSRARASRPPARCGPTWRRSEHAAAGWQRFDRRPSLCRVPARCRGRGRARPFAGRGPADPGGRRAVRRPARAGSALTEVEQVVRADGQVEPAGRVKIVNHPDGGRIAEIHVVEGQQVAAGAAAGDLRSPSWSGPSSPS